MSDGLSALQMRAWAGFVVTQGRLFRRIEEDLRRRADISHTEYEVLIRLAYAEDRRERIQMLASTGILSRSGISRAVDRLVKAGYVERADAAEDGRGAYAVLTDEGFARFKVIEADHIRLVREIFVDRFTEAELKQLGDFWMRFRDLP